MSPQRIQRQRTKGWTMPAGVLYVGRPSRWGNPFRPVVWGREDSIALYRNAVLGIWSPKILIARGIHDSLAQRTYADHLAWSERMGDHPLHMARAHLAGLDLACWCPLDLPCHADVLLELANPGWSP